MTVNEDVFSEIVSYLPLDGVGKLSNTCKKVNNLVHREIQRNRFFWSRSNTREHEKLSKRFTKHALAFLSSSTLTRQTNVWTILAILGSHLSIAKVYLNNKLFIKHLDSQKLLAIGKPQESVARLILEGNLSKKFSHIYLVFLGKYYLSCAEYLLQNYKLSQDHIMCLARAHRSIALRIYKAQSIYQLQKKHLLELAEKHLDIAKDIFQNDELLLSLNGEQIVRLGLADSTIASSIIDAINLFNIHDLVILGEKYLFIAEYLLKNEITSLSSWNIRKLAIAHKRIAEIVLKRDNPTEIIELSDLRVVGMTHLSVAEKILNKYGSKLDLWDYAGLLKAHKSICERFWKEHKQLFFRFSKEQLCSIGETNHNMAIRFLNEPVISSKLGGDEIFKLGCSNVDITNIIFENENMKQQLSTQQVGMLSEQKALVFSIAKLAQCFPKECTKRTVSEMETSTYNSPISHLNH